MCKKDFLYLALYKFLRENQILDKYIHNIVIQRPNRKRLKAKNILKGCIRIFLSCYNSNYNYISYIFACWESSFDWSASEEGREFWFSYNKKWMNFIKEFEKKYKLHLS